MWSRFSGGWEKVFMFVWGFAEATLFFVVPDVPVSFLATRGIRRALMGAVWAALGAVLGGAVMYVLAAWRPDWVLTMVEKVPAISVSMIESAREQVYRMGAFAMFKGAFSGVPYKVYASLYGANRFGLTAFLLLSFPARLLRFALVGSVIWALSRVVPRRLHVPLLTAGWFIFYSLFWYLMEW